MNDLNVVLLIGNLVRDAELKYTQQGLAISNFSIAVNRSKKQQDGQYVQEVSYFDISFFGKPAEALQQYLVKGTKVAVQGQLKQDRWQDRNTGANQSRVGIIAENLQLVGGRRDEQQQSPYAQQYQQQNRGYQPRQPQPQQQPQMYSVPEYNPATDQFPDEIPF